VVAAGSAALKTGPTDVIEVKGPDGWSARLFLDASTHLPAKITWMAKPFVTFTTSRMVAIPTNSRGQAIGPPQSEGNVAGPPPGDLTAGMADVEWETTMSDYRSADSVNWPHRLATTYAGRKYEDWRLERFKINPKIDPKLFRPGK
jgi:hypothetical protein